MIPQSIGKLVCRIGGHGKRVVVQDTGIQDAKAGGWDGDSYMEGNEECLGNYADENGNPIITRIAVSEARPVKDRHVTLCCERCGYVTDVGRWCEVGDEKTKLSDAAMIELADERECDL